MAILLKFPKDVILEGDYIIIKPEVSEQEFWELSNEDSNYELIDGVLIIHSPASEEHEDIFSHLNSILRYYLQETGKGRIYGSRFVMRLSQKWNPEPDILVIGPEKYKNVTKTRLDGPADLVIEILSKSIKEMDLGKKLPKYIESGVKEVWIIDPEEKSIRLITKEGEKNYNDPKSDIKIESKFLPELKLQVKWIWERNEYTSNKIIKTLFP